MAAPPPAGAGAGRAVAALGLALAALLAACAPQRTAGEAPFGVAVPRGPGTARTAVGFDRLPGWREDKVAAAVPAFLAACARPGGDEPARQAACTEAAALPPGDDAAARGFFERHFRPHLVSAEGAVRALVTGYYEPELRGARRRGGEFQTPLLRRPPEAASGRSMPTRAAIERGALANRRLELIWVADPVDAFFLHIQGSGRVRLPDGGIARVSYDGQNGQPYVPIGRILVDRGEMTLEQVSMQSIRAWLAAHPGEAAAIMEQNPSYIFFREIPDARPDEGPPGAMGVPLTPERSLAVDRGEIALGTPVWLDTLDPAGSAPVRRLTVAQDVGGAIRGPLRADLFFGWGTAAGEGAGRMRQPGTLYVLLPRDR